MGSFVWTEETESETLKKAIVVRLPPEGDMGDLVQIARAEGSKLFHGEKVKVVEAYRTSQNSEWIAVVQTCGDLCSNTPKKQTPTKDST
jgi:hypothetical protein